LDSVKPISRWMPIVAACLLLCGACGALPEARGSSSQGLSSSALDAGDLTAKIRSGEELDYDNITVTGALDLRDLKGPLRQPVRIINSRFQGPANFEGVTFAESLDLRGSSFQENVSFAKARFQGDAKFAGARFQGQADFRNAVFDGLASFTSASFFNDTSFGSVQFDGDAIFFASHFARDVDFNFAQFLRLGYFQDAHFQNVSFLETQFGGHATFLNAQFGGNATFAATRFDSDVVFRSSRFLSGCTFGLSSFGGLADFADVEFKKTAFFGGVKFADLAYFVNARFDKGLILEDARLYSMQLDNVTFGEGARINLNGTDFTKFVVRWNVIKGRMVYNGAAYLALVKNYKSLEWFDDADDCYYQYRKIGQDMQPWGWARFSDIISWLSCGYGVRVSYTIFGVSSPLYSLD